MSTFDGKVAEFPDIRIDYFRPDPQARPPLAFFLSHVHSDHLVGLETCKSPFIYCSPATRDILLRLEKYPHRMNFAKGILESRKQTYRHLKSLLKAIPLETPTEIELAPGNKIRVTLFDANHCVGAVMFLIEGGGKAILYTGDIRSELWWVNVLTRHPVLLPYASLPGVYSQKKLDCVYLDTTFVVSGNEDPYRQFPSKAEGIAELLQKVSQYPQNTIFYVDAWTFGYEDVWQALSVFLNSQIHVDDYRWGMYRALAHGVEPKAQEALKLIGFSCGNHFQKGCLSPDQQRIHSCEKGTDCPVWSQGFVRITPIISRHRGVELVEAGAGGGHGDLDQKHELEVDDVQLVSKLMVLCSKKLNSQAMEQMVSRLTMAMKEGEKALKLEDFAAIIQSEMPPSDSQDALGTDDLPLEQLLPALVQSVTHQRADHSQPRATAPSGSRRRSDGLPRQITFPYSRHSSYDELCLLVDAFKPRDVVPCTVDETHWSLASSMRTLFGHIYDERHNFQHDLVMLRKHGLQGMNAESEQRPSSSGTASELAAESIDGKVDRSSSLRAAQEQSTAAPRKRRWSADEAPIGIETYLKGRGPHALPSVEVARYSATPHEPRPSSAQACIKFSLKRDAQTMKEKPAQQSNPLLLAAAPRQPRQMQKSAKVIVKDAWMTTPRKRARQSPAYGRLTPPLPVSTESAEQVLTKPKDLWTTPPQRRPQPIDYGRLSPPKDYGNMTAHRASELKLQAGSARKISTPERLSFRGEVADAIAGAGGLSWWDIGLVSVNGHQTKEEEL